MKRPSRKVVPLRRDGTASDDGPEWAPNPAPKLSRKRIALVTEELSSTNGSGGIGGAFHELALALATAGHAVDIVFVPADEASANRATLRAYYAGLDITILEVPFADYVPAPLTTERKAYGLCCFLRGCDPEYDFIHFHDYKGLGFYALALKHQRLAFVQTRFVVQAHGPTRWTLEANGYAFSHEEQLKIDFMERACIARADFLVSPSRYLLGWFADHGWTLPSPDRVRVIQNVCTHLARRSFVQEADTRPGLCRFNEIAFFGRHEERKGLATFCDVLDEMQATLEGGDICITFLGRFGEINDTPSALYLAKRARDWHFRLQILPDYDREAVASYLHARPGALIVIASPVENSPYSVLEAIVLGRPLITSSQGGAKELLSARSAACLTSDINRLALATALEKALRDGLPRPELAIAAQTTVKHWLALHAEEDRPEPAANTNEPMPLVSVGIVHHDRPEKLIDAVLSIANQTYRHLEVVVIDDGSRKPATHAALDRMSPLFEKLGVRLIRQPNLYLGAARNRAALETTGTYLLFLDDDDIALPTMVQTLVTAAESTGSAVVNCLNLFMEESRRAEASPFPDRFEQSVSYLPLGGPISMAPVENCFGSATALIRREVFQAVGGYTEIHGVGHEDYELYVRMQQSGHRIEICPLPLYLYEVGRPSMISLTSRQKNFARVANAIDPRKFGEEGAADVISLLAGRRARDHTAQLQDYIIETSPQPELMRRILGTPTDSIAYAELIAAYADGLGSNRYAQAMLHLAHARWKGLDTPEAETARPIVVATHDAPTRHSAADDNFLLGAVVDAAYGRTEAAVTGLILGLQRRPAITSAAIRILTILRMSAPPDATLLDQLNAALGRIPMDDIQFESIAASLFQFAIWAKDARLLSAISERALERDEDRYLSLNPDVATAVREGTFSSGLNHFAAHPDEGRSGYALSTTLTDMLSGSAESPVGPAGLRGLVVSFARTGQLAKSSVRSSLLLATG